MVKRRTTGPKMIRKTITVLPEDWQKIEKAATETDENRSEYIINAALTRVNGCAVKKENIMDLDNKEFLDELSRRVCADPERVKQVQELQKWILDKRKREKSSAVSGN
ncbi:MAG: hypothetical protein H8E98_05405 [Bacteroidetes bacterium]|nr:hypothetical protein [Bacteroidota bacterium]